MNPESGNLEVWTHSLDPMRATVRVRLPWPLEPAAEVRGRLMGPRCRFATTVEVAYPFRQMEPSVYAAVIPEPSLWEPGCPFLYEGPIECSLGGNVIQRAWVRHCLRTTKMGAHGFLLNGKPFVVRPVQPVEGTEAELLELRGQGFNALQGDASAELRELADRIGFLVMSH